MATAVLTKEAEEKGYVPYGDKLLTPKGRLVDKYGGKFTGTLFPEDADDIRYDYYAEKNHVTDLTNKAPLKSEYKQSFKVDGRTINVHVIYV